MPLGLGVSRQPAAFLRKSPVFRCCFHAEITGRASRPFRMHGGHAGGTVSSATVSRAFVPRSMGAKQNPAEWPGRGPETRSHSGRGDAAEGSGHTNSLARAKFLPRARIYFLVGGWKH